jgi:hypothetical protein
MKTHVATLYITAKGRFVGCRATPGVGLWFSLDEETHTRILQMLDQEREVLDRLAKKNPASYREVRLKHISHTPLSIFLRSEEDLTMMRYYLQCQTVCGSQTWPLARVEESSQYHLR